MNSFLFRLIYFIVGVLMIGIWIPMDARLKGVVFFWIFPIIGFGLIFLSIFGGRDKKEE